MKSIDLEATTKLIQDPTYDAYASDLPILQTILLQGFIENYRIFPPEDPEDKESLPNISPQEYGIAFYSKSKYAQTIKKAIEFTRRKDNQDLDKYINIKQDNIDNKIRLLQDNFSNISPPDPPGNVNLWLWIQIIVFLIITIIVVTFIFRNPNYRDKFMYGIITIILTLFAIWGKEIVITLVELFR